jgi:hypothetical protein
MKTFLILFAILVSLPTMAITRASIQSLLLQKGTSLESLEKQGYKSILGETTGHAKSVPLSKVVVIITEEEVILKKEIEGTEVSGAPVVGNLQSVRFNGQYINSSDVVGVIVAP